MRADNSATRKPLAFHQRFFHAPGFAPWRGDSFRGVHLAKRLHFKWADVNGLKTKDQITAAFHSMRPLMRGWIDPLNSLPRDIKVSDLTWRQLSRLRPRRQRNYRPRTFDQILQLAAHLHIGIEFEPKNSRWTQTEAQAISDRATELGVPMIVKTLSTNTNALHNLAVFHRAGRKTVLLPRGSRRIPRSWWPYVDAVRGPVIWVGKTDPEAPKPPIPALGVRAIAAAAHQSKYGPQFEYGMCLQQCRLAFGAPAGTPDAIAAWNNASGKHRETNAMNIPAGYPIFWQGGSHGHGHIAISAGHGKCWSTDIRRRGYFDLVDIDLIHAEWGLTFLGYTTDLNGKAIA